MGGNGRFGMGRIGWDWVVMGGKGGKTLGLNWVELMKMGEMGVNGWDGTRKELVVLGCLSRLD